MYSNGRKTIGVFVAELNNDYQEALCTNIAQRATEQGYNVAFFCCQNNYSRSSEYGIGENNILELPIFEKLDGVILALDTYYFGDKTDKLISQIKRRCKCPVVSLRTPIDGFYNLLIDDSVNLESMISHFIENHNFTNICFMTGPMDRKDAIDRADTYVRVMKEHNLPLPPNSIYYGNFWKTVASQAIDFFFQNPEPPQVIACANDYMALSVCSELSKRGYDVPDDIVVSGFDNVKESSECIPSLTTVEVPFGELASHAVDLIHNINSGKENKHTQYIPTRDIYRESCGCMHQSKDELIHNRNRLIDEFDNMIHKNREVRYMSLTMESANTIIDVADVLNNSMYVNDNLQNFFVCLNCDTNRSQAVYSTQKGFTDTMWCPLITINGKKLEHTTTYFNRRQLLPAEYVGTEPQVYFFNPIHYQKSHFGYAAISFRKFQIYERSYIDQLSSLGSAFENARIRTEMNSLLHEMEELYIRDFLTGLYNRRGFERLSNQYFNKSIDSKENMMVLMIDMDGLKYVNDKYGHLQGDIALQAIGNALKYASVHGEISARVGGDEFSVIGYHYDEQMAQRFIDCFYQYLDEYNSTSGKDYHVNASHGYCVTSYQDDMGFEEYMNKADSLMYEEKNAKKLRIRELATAEGKEEIR